MKKIADGYWSFTENAYPSEGVKCAMTIDRIDGKDLDTYVEISGKLCISGGLREEFIAELGRGLDKYRI